MTSCSLISESSLREALVDVLLPLAPDDLRMLGVTRLDRAHERFWLTTGSQSTPIRKRNNKKKAPHLPIAFPV